jgi:hypothetical protein
VTVQIRANTVLPAHREPLSIRTGDGLRLVGELTDESGPADDWFLFFVTGSTDWVWAPANA